jgi:hypothetical protein
MMHARRRWSLCPVNTAEELAEKLTGQTWTLCTGWGHAGLWYLNDSTSEDGAQEYAVVCRGHQIESITFGWCTCERALRHIWHCTEHADELLDADWSHPVEPQVEDWREHRCRHCA